jgi:ABC-2 type transport system ATP-binding protein
MQREFYACLSLLADEGASILFSSHVLSEVHEICAIVGVMRAGKLVFEKPVAELVAESARRVELEFKGEPPDLESVKLPGAMKVERRGSRFRIFVDGDVDALIKAIAEYEVADIVFERPDLEDLFMKYYRDA